MRESENSSSTVPEVGSRLGPWVLLPVLAGLFLRGLDAASKSLWLDELHSLYISWADDLAGVCERISHDFHPPVYFAILHFLDGVDPHALRWVSILPGMLTLIPLLDLARTAGLSRSARLALAFVFSCAPYQVMYGAELRAYPILQLAAVSIAWATFTDEKSARTRFIVFAAATAVGLYFHYFTAMAVIAAGTARLLVRSTSFLRWKTIVLAGTVGVIAFLPWILAVESWILTDPGVMFRPEQQDRPEQVAEEHDVDFFDQDFSKVPFIVPRSFMPMIESLGERVGPFAKVAAAAFFLLVAILLANAALRFVKGARVDRRIVGALTMSVVGYGMTAFLCLYLWRRVPEQYFTSAAWSWPLVIAVLVDLIEREKLQRAALTLFAIFTFAAGLCHALGAPREDTRAGVAKALELGEGRDAIYSAALAQPLWYSDDVPYRVYAPDSNFFEPTDVPVDERPVIVITRKTWYTKQKSKWPSIKEGRELEQSVQVDEAIWVHVFVAK